MNVAEITRYLSHVIPLELQEGYDNSGLQVGDPGQEISEVLLTLDVTEEVLEEAIESKCDLIISHHPLIFGGMKSINTGNQVGRIISGAIRNGISIYSAHTNLDMVENGVSYRMAEKIGLKEIKTLAPLKGRLLKIVVFVPHSHTELVKEAMYSAGAGTIGKYDHCSFNIEGKGTFRASEGSNPWSGNIGEDHAENELRVEMILPDYKLDSVIESILKSHPYEEVAYDIYRLENLSPSTGLGAWGRLSETVDGLSFLSMLKETFGSGCVKYTGETANRISTVALCGGSGSSLIADAKKVGADIFISGDIKYHSFFETDGKMLIADIGHYESEKFSLEILYELITKKFPKFAVRFSKHNTNPINYL